MSSRRRNQAVQRFLYRAFSLPRRALKALITNLLRVLLMWGRRPSATRAGFILPTTVMLLLVTSLAVGSISLRTYTRTQQTIGDRAQLVIYNAATPAIDRAKAKLEYLFSGEDDRLPSGIPGEDFLFAMMVNADDGQPRAGITINPHQPDAQDGSNIADPYTFDDEERLDLEDADALPDNAWKYPADTDGDGNNDSWVIYSIIFGTPDDLNDLRKTDLGAQADRAKDLQVRQAPLSITSSGGKCAGGAAAIEDGWFSPPGGGTATKTKNFQISAVVIPAVADANGNLADPDPRATVATLEFQQDRKIDQGNKWGAWFRNDLEIFPNPDFRWNGAMHTEGNLVVGRNAETDAPKFTAYLISSTNSCLNTSADASEVTVGKHETQNPSFLGHVINGIVYENTFTQQSAFHIFQDGGGVDTAKTLNDDNDSLKDDDLGTLGEVDFTLDPVVLLTQDEYKARNANDPDDNLREDNWKGDVENPADPPIQARISNKEQRVPRVGDSYRADNRYGPQARYIEDPTFTPPNVGTLVSEPDLVKDGSPEQTDVGLDGYWERRARNDGMRVIVGQRLELGNAFGWDKLPADNDPLKPWDVLACDDTINPNNDDSTRGGCYVTRQRRTLRDNLAAIQATAVYHADPHAATPINDGDFPQACLISTVHPGTPETLERSATFANLTAELESLWDDAPFFDAAAGPGTTDLKPFYSNVFLGEGTNGWEYQTPLVTTFHTETEMMKAMRNLATYAGDPKGGAPSFTPVQDTAVHPNPNMAMWGDFSMLRRILDGPLATPSQTAYEALSPADKTTLHTAGCLIGMLAYNTAYLQLANVPDDPSLNPLTNDLESILSQVESAIGTDIDITDAGGTDIATANLPQGIFDTDGNGAVDLKPEAFVGALNYLVEEAGQTALAKYANLAEIVMLREQIERDRQNGFGTGYSNNCNTWRANGDKLANLCVEDPKYPVLYSIFPAPDPSGTPGAGNHSEENDKTRDGPVPTYISTANGSATYQEIDLSDATVLTSLALAPETIDAWNLPKDENVTPTGGFPNNSQDVVIACVDEACGPTVTGSQAIRVPFKDSALFDGRQMMSVRVLDMELDLLRRNDFGSDKWLPRTGIVYAFREDTLREDSIVRPKNPALVVACDTDNAIQTVDNCQMRAGGEGAVASNTYDPPLTPQLYSVKPVDYIPDADRRANGIRLRNGAELGRDGDGGRGLSLISDAPVYIQGDFNEHIANGNPVEEFDDLLDADYADFYTRNTPDENFANPAPGKDLWRPSEILADSVTVLSNHFCDGSILDGFLVAGTWPAPGGGVPNSATIDAAVNGKYGCQGNGNRTSYLNQISPEESGDWQHENPYDPTSPVLVSRHGNPYLTTNEDYKGRYYPIGRRRPLIVPAETTVNATIISGIVPSRKNQSYGGLQNFPRFLENWANQPGGGDDVNLFMSGSFLQLNFSTSATAPYDQDAWQPEDPPVADENITYYAAPKRRWGYDVALQYAPAGPIASRFVIPNNTRSEFYSEPPIDDPYVAQLCRAAFVGSNFCEAAPAL
ncbi:MAG: hormogonium polysaccharide biosynthesis protein HpsA [Synechococcales bacterium]|nr:hormogonium polysaccharide biosynthesis protein HpsA [Synechococcales bacterium]